MSDKHEKMLERVRGLLAKAASTEFDAEADAFRAKADELMTKYAIQLWQVEQAQAGVNAPTTPEIKHMDISWWYEVDRQIGAGLWSVFLSVTGHCRCRVAYKYADGYSKTIPVIGMPADLGYADMLFTHLFMQMMDRMDPKPKPGEPLVEALGRMKEAGMKWEDIFHRLRDAGYYPEGMAWNASKMNFAGKLHAILPNARTRTGLHQPQACTGARSWQASPWRWQDGSSSSARSRGRRRAAWRWPCATSVHWFETTCWTTSRTWASAHVASWPVTRRWTRA